MHITQVRPHPSSGSLPQPLPAAHRSEQHALLEQSAAQAGELAALEATVEQVRVRVQGGGQACWGAWEGEAGAGAEAEA